MTGYANYDDAFDPKYGEPFKISLVRATKESLTDIGRLVYDYEEEELIIKPWPQTGKRPICPGTGIGKMCETVHRYYWEEDRLLGEGVFEVPTERATNSFSAGRLPRGVTPDRRTHSLCREANYHPDSGQVFIAADKKPFVGVLAKPGDDIKLEDFKAFYFDGSFGIQIYPCVWHQHFIPVQESVCIKSKQSMALPCVTLDSGDEFNTFMMIPLLPEFITV